MANSHWSASHLQSGKVGTLPSSWLMWGRWSLDAAGSPLLELPRYDWQMNFLLFCWLHAWLASFSLSYVSLEELRREELGESCV